MLIDNLNTFSDNQAITATADSTSKVNVMPFMGKNDCDCCYLTVKVGASFNNLTSLDIDLQTSATESGTYTSVQKLSAVPLASLTKGARLGFRCLPSTFKQPWAKLVYTVNGSAPSTGSIFAALTREEPAPYEAGLYINRGVVVG